jgi:RimJ/RimL family protein N-acetyltransferase
LTFERTVDFHLVRSILTGPGIYPHITDDFSPAREVFEVNQNAAIWYVLAIDGGKVVGLFSLLPRNAIRWELHFAMVRKVSPKITREAGRGIVPWIWEYTHCKRLMAEVPVCNKAAVRYGLRAMGLKAFGRDRAAFLKNGKLVDLICMGISRPPAPIQFTI